jgi:hypothetical protein
MNEDFAPPVPQSQLSFLASAIGGNYLVLLLLSALVAFVLTLLLVIRGKGPAAAAALLLVVPLSMFVGAYGAVDAWITTFQTIAASMVQPKPSLWANGMASASVRVMTGMFLAGPSLVVATLGSSIRAWIGDKSTP